MSWLGQMLGGLQVLLFVQGNDDPDSGWKIGGRRDGATGQHRFDAPSRSIKMGLYSLENML